MEAWMATSAQMTGWDTELGSRAGDGIQLKPREYSAIHKSFKDLTHDGERLARVDGDVLRCCGPQRASVALTCSTMTVATPVLAQ